MRKAGDGGTGRSVSIPDPDSRWQRERREVALLGVTTCGRKDALSWEGWVPLDMNEQKSPAPEKIMGFLGISTSVLLGIRFRCLEPDSPFPPSPGQVWVPLCAWAATEAPQPVGGLMLRCFGHKRGWEDTLLENFNGLSSLSSRGKMGNLSPRTLRTCC